ncbi:MULTISPECIES: hypothetical protein [unclassified Sutcliffiella]|uniref:hypothetical protein n=1 Tax=unclassified Sutcliffiella TaxID=2837532 RepID=UPI0030D0EE59
MSRNTRKDYSISRPAAKAPTVPKIATTTPGRIRSGERPAYSAPTVPPKKS